ncbi:MAG: hypothetical protein ACRDL7_00040 [Gaiellaceae bacterium]
MSADNVTASPDPTLGRSDGAIQGMDACENSVIAQEIIGASGSSMRNYYEICQEVAVGHDDGSCLVSTTTDTLGPEAGVQIIDTPQRCEELGNKKRAASMSPIADNRSSRSCCGKNGTREEQTDFVDLLDEQSIDGVDPSLWSDDDSQEAIYLEELRGRLEEDSKVCSFDRPVDLANCNSHSFNQQLNYHHPTQHVSTNDGEANHKAEEQLMHYVKKHNLSPAVYDFVMSWVGEALEGGFRFKGRKYRTVLDRMIRQHGQLAGGLPIRGSVDVEGFPPVDMYRNNFLQHARRMYADPDLMQDGLWSFNNSTNGYGELNTGTFWKECEGCIAARLNRAKSKFANYSMPHNHYIAPIILFDDGTQCDGLGRLVAHPVLFSLGNINGMNRRSHRAWSILSILPPYPKTQEEQAQDRSKLATPPGSLNFYHDCLTMALSEIRFLCNRKEGVPMYVSCLGDVTLHFDLCCIIGDADGHDKMCCHYSAHSAKLKRMLRDCNVPTEHGDDPFFKCTKTRVQDIRAVVDPAILACGMFGDGTLNAEQRGKQQQALKNISQHPVASAYWKFSFGKGGVHQSVPHEILHVFYLGLFKRMLHAIYNHSKVPEELKDWLSERKKHSELGSLTNRPNKLSKSRTFRVHEFERRVRKVSFDASRQSDRDFSKPPFRHGVTKLTRLNGQEYPGLILISVVCMGSILDEDTYAEARKVEAKYSLLMWRSLSLEVMLTKEHYTPSYLKLLESRMRSYLDLYRDVIGPQRELESVCGLRLPKFHGATHFVDQIRRFGSHHNISGTYLESCLKPFVKQPIGRTSRQHSRFIFELMIRNYEYNVVDIAVKKHKEEERKANEASVFMGNSATVNRDHHNAGNEVGTALRQRRLRLEVGRNIAGDALQQEVWDYRCGKPNFVVSKSDTPANVWKSYVGNKMYTNACHPFLPTPDGYEWIDLLIREAEACGCDEVRCFMHVDIPNINDKLHNILRADPNFRGGHSSEKKPWFDWAMVKYSNADCASRLCLFGEMTPSRASPADSKTPEPIMYAVVKPLVVGTASRPQKHHLLPWFDAGNIADKALCVEFSSINSVAYVLPTSPLQPRPRRRAVVRHRNTGSQRYNPSGEDLFAFPDNAADHKYFVVIPPRHEWDQYGWSDDEEDQEDDSCIAENSD